MSKPESEHKMLDAWMCYLYSDSELPMPFSIGHLTPKNDIYSFGIVLLEMMTGRRVLDENRTAKEKDLVKWAMPYLRKEKISRIMDTRIQGQYSSRSAKTIGNLVIQCLSVDPRFRPNMEDVVSTLEQLQDSKATVDLYPIDCDLYPTKSEVKHGPNHHKPSQGPKNRRRSNIAHEICKGGDTISPDFTSSIAPVSS